MRISGDAMSAADSLDSIWNPGIKTIVPILPLQIIWPVITVQFLRIGLTYCLNILYRSFSLLTILYNLFGQLFSVQILRIALHYCLYS